MPAVRAWRSHLQESLEPVILEFELHIHSMNSPGDCHTQITFTD